jgi:predicted HicB family RNase H-like nuclease
VFVAVCPTLGDLSALGKTAPAAVAELEQAIELALETYVAQGWPVPEPDIVEEYSGQFRLRLPRSLHAWLVHEAERQGVSLNTLVTSLLAHARGECAVSQPAPAQASPPKAKSRETASRVAEAVPKRHSATTTKHRR